MQSHYVLVINCGSSSLKFSLLNPDNADTVLTGIAERLNGEQACISFHLAGQKSSQPLAKPYDHRSAISALVAILQQQNLVEHVMAVGHRVVHGGEQYAAPVVINSEVKQQIQRLAQLAPLHNPANLQGINAAEQCFAKIPHVAIFDTAFHQTMPQKSYLYGLPYALYQQHGIRKYGFHGTSHYYVAQQLAKKLDKPLDQCQLISAHLGNGCSVTATCRGKSIDSSMGFTPLEGVMMGTRSGSIDPGIIFHLISQLDYSAEQVHSMLNHQSGLLGLSGISNDCRELEQAIAEGNSRAILALEVFCYQIAKAIAALSASLTQLDALVFTGGIGENSCYVRAQILKHLSLLNFALDSNANQQTTGGISGKISAAQSRQCWVIPTNEEWVIAQQSQQLLSKG